jgi:replicative DNA helicase
MQDEFKLSDLAAERAVLVGLLQYGEDAYLDIADFINSSSFTDTLNQAVYKCIKHLYEQQDISQFDQSSVLAVAHELGYEALFDKPADIQHLRSLFNGRVLLPNVRKWAGQIRKLEIARLLRDQLRDAAFTLEDVKGTESIDAILGIAETVVFDFTSLLHDEETSTPTLIGDGLDAFLDNIEDNPVDIVGISSGLPYYDQAIGGGFRRKTVSLLGARSKVGKSMVAANIALHVAKNVGIPVLYLDTEMTKEDHWGRLLPALCLENNTKVTINDLESGQYVKNGFTQKRVREAAETLRQLSIHYLNVSGKPFEEIISIMRRWVTKEVGFDEQGVRKDCLIVYDYLKMMSSEGVNESLKEYQVLGFMTTSLHNFCVRHDVPCLSFIQLNRDGIDKESQDVISGSDRILWLVTNFTIYKVKSPEEIAADGPEHGNRKLVPVSARHGEGMDPGDYINVHFYGKYGKIVEGETKNNLKHSKKKASPLIDTDTVPLNDVDDNVEKDEHTYDGDQSGMQ